MYKRQDFETPYAVAKGLKENFVLDMAVILGGEPTLFRDETIQLIQRIHALGVRTRLETNAWWAESYEKALDLVSALKAVSYTHLSSQSEIVVAYRRFVAQWESSTQCS